MAQITRKNLIDDLELRLSRTKPSNDFQPTKAILGAWVDQARDAFYGQKISKLAKSKYQVSGKAVESEELTPVISLINLDYYEQEVTLSKTLLNVDSEYDAEPSVITAFWLNATPTTTVQTDKAGLQSIAKYNLEDNIVLVGGDTGAVWLSHAGGPKLGDLAIGGESGTVWGIAIFKDGTIWAHIEELDSSNINFYVSSINDATWVKHQISQVAAQGGAMKQSKDGDKIIAWCNNGTTGEVSYIANTTDLSNYQQFSGFVTALPASINVPCVVDSVTAIIAGDNGYLARSTTGFQGTDNFKDISLSGISDAILDVDFANKNEGIILYDNNAPCFTMDGGATWGVMAPPFADFSYIDGKVTSVGNGEFFISILGGGDMTVHTDDYGDTWDVVSTTEIRAEDVVMREGGFDILGGNTSFIRRSLYVEETSRQHVKIVQPGAARELAGLRFAKPSENNIVGYMDGNKLVFVGNTILESPTGKIRVRYIAEAQAYADTVPYPAANTDLDLIMDIALDTGMRALGIPEFQDDLNDGTAG